MLAYIFAGSLIEAYLFHVLRLVHVSNVALVSGVLLLNCSVFGFYSFFVYPKYLSPLRHLPMAPGGRVIGGHTEVKFRTPQGPPMLRSWFESIPNDGLFRVKELFQGDGVVATSPEILKTVLTDSCYEYVKASQIKRILRMLVGNGLIVLEGDVHRSERRRLNPSFGAGAIKDLYPLFWDKSSELAQSLSSLPDLRNVAFGPWCSRATLDIIGVAALGKDFNSLQEPDNPLVHNYNEALKASVAKQVWFVLNFLFPERLVLKIPFWKMPKAMNRIKRELYAYSEGLASERRAEFAAGVSLETKAETFQLRRADILSNLVLANELDDATLAHESLTMLGAGHETTSSSLSWAAVLLSQNQDIQDKLREEIRAHLPSPNLSETVSLAQIEKMPLLNAVCHETLRLYPTVPFSARTAVHSTTLGDITLRKGTQVWLPIWSINRTPKLWGEDAEVFNPSRWITNGAFNNNGGVKSNYSLLTFLHGPRSCIGQGFAKAELKCLVAAIVGRFRLELAEPDSKYIPVGLVTIKPENDTLLNMSIVDGW